MTPQCCTSYTVKSAVCLYSIYMYKYAVVMNTHSTCTNYYTITLDVPQVSTVRNSCHLLQWTH